MLNQELATMPSCRPVPGLAALAMGLAMALVSVIMVMPFYDYDTTTEEVLWSLYECWLASAL
jgi:hypothetical protein